MNEIKQIRTVTLSKDNPVSLNYDMAIDFLSDGLINKQNGHYHYISKNISLVGIICTLFKYKKSNLTEFTKKFQHTLPNWSQNIKK